MEALGREVLDRLELRGDERVLDAGCGSGRITEALIERLPRGRGDRRGPVARRWSQAARERLGEDADVRVADLLELELEEPVDAILSTATFHWIADHERLFARLHARAAPGGRLRRAVRGRGQHRRPARHGRRGAREREPYAAALRRLAGAVELRRPARSPASGCSRPASQSAECWLAPAPREPEDPREFLSTIVLGPHVQQLPAALREPLHGRRARASSASRSSSTTCA